MKIFYFMTLLLFLNSCNVKHYTLLKKAKLEQKIEKQNIPYEEIYDFVIIPVKIDGDTYRFLFDTGAQTTLITENLVNKLTSQKLGKINVTDSQYKTKKLKAFKINKLSIGEVTYSEIGVIANDFSGSVFECMGIDGELGMNVISLSNW